MRTKLFGLVVIAALAISAVAAASAISSYHSEIEVVNIKGVQQTESVFTTDIGNVKCTTVTLTGTSIKGTKVAAGDFTAKEIKVHPLFGKATGSGNCTLAGLTVKIETGECDLNFKEAENIVKGKTAKAAIDAVCPSEASKMVIKDTAGLGCEVTVGDEIAKVPVNQGIQSLKFANLGAGANREVEVTAELTGMTYEWSANCPSAKGKAGKNSNGTYTGIVRLKSSNPAGGAQVGTWIEN